MYKKYKKKMGFCQNRGSMTSEGRKRRTFGKKDTSGENLLEGAKNETRNGKKIG